MNGSLQRAQLGFSFADKDFMTRERLIHNQILTLPPCPVYFLTAY
jgi:hypothetical protein